MTPLIAKPTKPTVHHLYHYSSANRLDWLESIILEHELYFSTPRELNDPAEGRPRIALMSPDQIFKFLFESFVRMNSAKPIEVHCRAVREIASACRTLGPDKLVRMMVESLHREFEGHRIYSLSKRYDNLMLWANYASNHKGYCLEFSIAGPPFTSALEVAYDGQVSLDLTDGEKIDYWFFYRKSPEWSNEEEVRIVFPRICPPKVRFDPALLTRVIIGKDMLDADKTRIRECAQKRNPNLVVSCAEYDPIEQKLSISP